MDAGEPRMSFKKSSHRVKKRLTPLFISIANRASVWPANPRHHAEASELIKKLFRPLWIHCRYRPLNVCRTKMGKDIRDVMLTKLCRERANCFLVSVTADFIHLSVSSEPPAVAEPAVRNPDCVLAAVVATIPHIKTRRPEGVATEEKQKQTTAWHDRAPGRLFDFLPKAHLRKISFSCLVVVSKSRSNESQSGFSASDSIFP